MCQEADCPNTQVSVNVNVPSLHRLEVQADVQKEVFPKDTASLGAISDNASTRAMAGSIISSYNPQDRYVGSQSPGQPPHWVLGLEKLPSSSKVPCGV